MTCLNFSVLLIISIIHLRSFFVSYLDYKINPKFLKKKLTPGTAKQEARLFPLALPFEKLPDVWPVSPVCKKVGLCNSLTGEPLTFFICCKHARLALPFFSIWLVHIINFNLRLFYGSLVIGSYIDFYIIQPFF